MGKCVYRGWIIDLMLDEKGGEGRQKPTEGYWYLFTIRHLQTDKKGSEWKVGWDGVGWWKSIEKKAPSFYWPDISALYSTDGVRVVAATFDNNNHKYDIGFHRAGTYHIPSCVGGESIEATVLYAYTNWRWLWWDEISAAGSILGEASRRETRERTGRPKCRALINTLKIPLGISENRVAVSALLPLGRQDSLLNFPPIRTHS